MVPGAAAGVVPPPGRICSRCLSRASTIFGSGTVSSLHPVVTNAPIMSKPPNTIKVDLFFIFVTSLQKWDNP